MDTRSKIVTTDDAYRLLEEADAKDVAVAVGLFDPLTIEIARKLDTISGKQLLAVVLEDAQAMQAASSRAGLVAALRTVSRVVIAPQEMWRSIVPPTFRGQVYFDPAIEAEESRVFVERVLQKQATTSR